MNEKAQNLLSGAEGVIFIDGVEQGYVKSVEATAEKVKAERRIVGRRNTFHKTTGWNGTGTLILYKTTSAFRQQISNYIKNGVDVYVDIQITTQDPSATDIGKEVSILRGVNFDSIPLAMIDPEAEILEDEMPFTFEDYDLTEKFNL